MITCKTELTLNGCYNYLGFEALYKPWEEWSGRVNSNSRRSWAIIRKNPSEQWPSNTAARGHSARECYTVAVRITLTFYIPRNGSVPNHPQFWAPLKSGALAPYLLWTSLNT